MDSNSIATLQDYQQAVERTFTKLQKKIKDFDTSETSQQNILLNGMNGDIRSIKNNISLMKMELSNLNEEANQTKWQEIITKLQSQSDFYKKEINSKKNQKKSGGPVDPTDIDVKVNLAGLTSQQAMDRGDAILRDDRRAIENMKNIVGSDVRTMKEVNANLKSQKEQLENADKDLKEIDYSLKRAGEQMKTMFKMYATDKLIMCMIVVILLVIIAIIVVSLVGKDKNKNFNVPNDIFSNDGKTKTDS